MKILLITLPPEGETRDYTTSKYFVNNAVKYMPLGILCVANGIDQRHEVEILDASSLGLSIQETIDRINAYGPDVLGISAITRRVYALKKILESVTGVVKAVGGPHVTTYAEQTLAMGAQAVFKGDGDFRFGRWLEEGMESGIFEDRIQDINQVPFPRRELVDLDFYAVDTEAAATTLFKKSGLRIPMFSSRGCPFRCVFCDVQEKTFRYLSPSRVVDEMQHLLKVGAGAVHILDDCFNVIEDRVLAICGEIKNRNLQFEWSARGRAKMSEDSARELAAAGCKRLHVGIESLDDEVLRWMGKAIDVKTIRHFMEMCNKYGIETVGYFIIGTPVESQEYRENLISKIKDLGVTYPYFNLLYPSANSEYYFSLLKNGTFKQDYWAEFMAAPVADYDLPLPRDHKEHEELLALLDWYVKEFYKK